MPERTYRSGHCGIESHDRCRGTYAGTPCACQCHTTATPPPRVDTTQVRLYLEREPAKTQGCARLIRTLCEEIDDLRRELGAARLNELVAVVPPCPLDDP